MIVLWAVACGLPPGPGVVDTVVEVPATPQIASFDFSCDVEGGKFTIEVQTTAWSGGGVTHWTVDGVYLERHTVLSESYAEDGSSETLKRTVNIVSDWRNQSNNSSTAFTCADDINVVFRLDDFDGKQVDCRVLGPAPDRWPEIEGTPNCDIVWP